MALPYVTIRVRQRRYWLVALMTPALWVAFVMTAQGQAEKLVVNPPLSQVFPLDPKPDGMRLMYPVLVNDRTILGPNVVLRFIYDDPNAGMHLHGGGGGAGGGGGSGGGGQGGGRHHGGGGGGGGDGDDDPGAAYSRSVGTPGGGKGDAGPGGDPGDGNKDAKTEIATEVWTNTGLFREALDQAADLGTTLVYSAPGKPHPQSTTIDLPDGMLLAEVNGHVRVLALTDESEAGSGGLRANDEIRSFNGGAAVDSLADFLRVYSAVKKQAQSSDRPYSMGVWRPGESRVVLIQVGAPPSIPGLFGP